MNNNLFIMNKIITNKRKYINLYLKYKSILADLKTSSQKVYTSVLNTFCDFLTLQINNNVKFDAINFMEFLKMKQKNQVVNYNMMVVDCFMNYLYIQKYINEQIFIKPKNLKVPITKKQSISIEDMNVMLDKLPKLYQLIVKVLYSTGMRKSELINLKVKDVTQGTIITSKYDNERSIFFKDEIYNEIQIYIKQNNKKDNEYLFTSNRGTKFHASTWNVQLKKYGVNPHALRILYATQHAQNNVPISVLKVLMGHKNICTTEKYIQHTDEELLKVVNGRNVV